MSARSPHPSFLIIAVACAPMATASPADQEQPARPPATPTRVVLLGTGTPPADPDRSGPSTAIVVNGTAYLVDFGASCDARRPPSRTGIDALSRQGARLRDHLHSIHVGYPT
jgi:hypothetical protein